MSYPIFTVANTILEKSISEAGLLTHMKLQKMAYCLHGWHLAALGAPVCFEHAEAWKYGPVWGGLYHALKHHGHDKIGPRDFICEPGEQDQLVYYTVPKTDVACHDILEEVWRKYAPYSALELSKLTHQSGTPWEKARQLGNDFIDNDEIKKHFREEVGVVAYVR